ncbi:DUF362 domain-containing protein [Vallitalea sp.]|uniref:DUF362 domain-containing protein n=1 Tax=Vallitalea sp. TaxID=1882829 RepID=UPI0025D73781|nr:DUF362 domain-containing protein [Vallitalea sp.]MCT4686880.1 DUF362 domain-containing protein [Vallitalea sp.]
MRQRKRMSSDVSITRNANESQAITEGLNNITANQLINNNDVVVITPNWVNLDKPNPSLGVVVGGDSLRTIIQYVKGSNPKKIIIATGSGGQPTSDVMKKVGYDQIIQSEGIEFIDLNYGPYTTISLNNERPSSTKINQIINEATVLISFTQLKHHESATMSACIKNIALAWPPAEIHGYPKKALGIHDNIHSFITAMAEAVPIDISILSCNPTMIGTGPTGGIPRHTELVICGTDPVSVDTIGARFLGFKTEAVGYLDKCDRLKIGVTDLKQMNMTGLDLVSAEQQFSKTVYGETIAIDSK